MTVWQERSEGKGYPDEILRREKEFSRFCRVIIRDFLFLWRILQSRRGRLDGVFSDGWGWKKGWQY
jgi:hypothetical protein